MKEVRVFISSPGDVRHERVITRRVIDRLDKDFAGRADIVPIMWEDMPLLTTCSFQEGIDKVIEELKPDIAIFIFWSRLGSSPGAGFIREDGTQYGSGTEYEYDLFSSAFKQSGKPAIIAYTCTRPVQNIFSTLTTEAELQASLLQLAALEDFKEKNFRNSKTGEVLGAYHEYSSYTEYEERLLVHLRQLIENIVGKQERIEWEGNPYVGLVPYSARESSVFYGRREVVGQIMDLLIERLRFGAPSLFLLGASGSGKSSLVRAGIIPEITQYDLVEGAQWKIIDISPSSLGGQAYDGFINLLSDILDNNASPVFEYLGTRDLDSTSLVDEIGKVCSRLPYIPLVYIDQFEELFTDMKVSEKDRTDILSLILLMLQSRKIWLVFSMRNDFYHLFSSVEILSQIKDGSIVYDVKRPSSLEIQEIVEEPSRKAGYLWEVDEERGIKLSRQIVNEINDKQLDLSLVQFSLFELVQRCSDTRLLSFKAYENIGGLEGSVAKYSEDCISHLSPAERSIFFSLIGRMVSFSGNENRILSKKSVSYESLSEDQMEVVDKLVKCHLITATSGSSGRPYVSLSHEILLSVCPTIKQWADQNLNLIEQNAYYDGMSSNWLSNMMSNNYLIKDRAAVEDAECFMILYDESVSPETAQFIYKSSKKHRRKGLLVMWFFFPNLLLSLFLLALTSPSQWFPYFNFHVSNQAGGIILESYVLFLFVYFFTLIRKGNTRVSRKRYRNAIVFWLVTVLFQVLITISAIVGGADIFNLWPLYILIIVYSGFLFIAIDSYNSLLITSKNSNGRHLLKNKRLTSLFTKFPFRVGLGLIILLGINGIGYTIIEKSEVASALDKAIVELQRDIYSRRDKMDENTYFSIVNSFANRFKESVIDQYDENMSNISAYVESQYQLYNDINLIHLENEQGFLSQFENGLFNDASHSLDVLIAQFDSREIDNSGYDYGRDILWPSILLGSYGKSKLISDKIEETGKELDTLVKLRIGHCLLLNGDTDGACRYYDEVLKANPSFFNESMKADYAALRWFGADDTVLSSMEAHYELNKSYDIPGTAQDDRCDALGLLGDWTYMEGGLVGELRISGYFGIQIMSRRSFVSGQRDRPVYAGRSFFHLINSDNQYYVYEYDFRRNSFTISQIEKLTEDTLVLKVIFETKDSGHQITTYSR